PDHRIGEHIGIVLEADEIDRILARGPEVGERETQRIEQWEHVEDDEERYRRDDEQVPNGDVAPPARGSARSRTERRHHVIQSKFPRVRKSAGKEMPPP